jgi:hypothetical protein
MQKRVGEERRGEGVKESKGRIQYIPIAIQVPF